jgi:transcriptional regulator with XRE-family HTH domain
MASPSVCLRVARERKHRSQAGVENALPDLLVEHDVSLRQLAKDTGISVSYLSRVLAGTKPSSGELAARIASALELPDDYFPETREQRVVEAVRADPDLRERIYRRL